MFNMFKKKKKTEPEVPVVTFDWVNEKPWWGLLPCTCGGKPYVAGKDGPIETGAPYHVYCTECGKRGSDWPTHQRACAGWRRLNIPNRMIGCSLDGDKEPT